MNHNNHVFALLALIGWGWLGAANANPPASAQRVQQQDKASIWFVTAEKDPRQLRLSEELRIQVRVEGMAPLEVEVLGDWLTTKSWKLNVREPTLAPSTWLREVVLTPFEPGEHVLQVPPIRYRERGGDWHTVTWQPIRLKVVTQVANAKPAAARDITNIEELPTHPPSGTWILWLGAGVALVVLAATVAFIRRQRSGPASIVPPELIALRDLERLASQTPTATADVELFHVRLSQVMRQFLERFLRIPARKQTTAEFIAALEKEPRLTTEQREIVNEILARCDLAKFARVQGSVREWDDLVGRSRVLIQGMATSERPDRCHGAASEPGA
jgi:hypothetical protein